MQSKFYYRYGFFDVVGMMLIGMALLKLGIITGEKSMRFYAVMMLAGYGIGLPVNAWETWQIVDSRFDILTIARTGLTYDLALYGHRSASQDGVERFTLNGADAARSSSSVRSPRLEALWVSASTERPMARHSSLRCCHDCQPAPAKTSQIHCFPALSPSSS